MKVRAGILPVILIIACGLITAACSQTGYENLAAGSEYHGFRVASVYLNDADRPMGARLVHERTGFVFDDFSSEALFGALRRCHEVYGDRKAWDRLVQNGMSKNFSWDRQGRYYVQLYEILRSG